VELNPLIPSKPSLLVRADEDGIRNHYTERQPFADHAAALVAFLVNTRLSMSTPNSFSMRAWNPWPVSIIVFFTIAILGCGSFVVFCSRHPADLISPNYYEDEVRYQAQIDRMKLTQQQAPQAFVSFEAATKHITLSLGPARSGARIAGRILLYRPSALKQDRQLDLNVNSQGEQIVDGAELEPGLWRVRVSWTVDDQQYFMEQPMIVPGAWSAGVSPAFPEAPNTKTGQPAAGAPGTI
jgi:hypothetical protein